MRTTVSTKGQIVLPAEIRKLDGIKPGQEMESFQGELRTYQRDGLGWFDFLRRFGFGGCLAEPAPRVLQLLRLKIGASSGSAKRLAGLDWDDERRYHTNV